MVQFFCERCDPDHENPIQHKKKCAICGQQLHFFCHAAKGIISKGLYKNYSRHVKKCVACSGSRGQGTKREQAERRQDVYQQHQALEQAYNDQEPAASLLRDENLLHRETGISSQSFDIVLRAARDDLINLHKGKQYYQEHVLLSAENLLLLYLIFLRQRPSEEKLAETFGIAKGGCFALVRRVATVLAPIIEHFVNPPSRIHQLHSGHLKGAAFFTDTSDTQIPRPGRGHKPERHLYYFFKKGGSWAVKWQVSIGLNGKIWEHGNAGYPGSISDRQIFEESKLPKLIEKTGVHGVGDSHYVRCRGMYGKRLGAKQAVEYEAYNEEIDAVRAIVENLNHRIKLWKGLKEWKCNRKDLEFFAQCLSAVCGLLNLEIDQRHPIRRFLQTTRPSVAVPRLQRKKREREEAAEEADEKGEAPRTKIRKTKEGQMQEEASEKEEVDEQEEILSEEDAEEADAWYEIDNIIRHKNDIDYGLMYLVKYTDGSKLWLTPEHISEDAIHEYISRQGQSDHYDTN